MKNSLLYCLAAASLALSFFFERPSTDASGTACAPSAPAVAEASLFPALLENEPESTPAGTAKGPVNAADALAAAAARDSITYHYYAQTLGLHLDYNENKDLLQAVTNWVGTPYSYGSNSQRYGTDCSGFVTRVFKEVYGITLKRSSRSMFTTVKRVARKEMHTGDLVFFRRGRGPIYHVGIYLKDGKFAHSACGKGVTISSLREGYYNHNFYAAGRVMAIEPAAEVAVAE